jgi:hypothetical protein
MASVDNEEIESNRELSAATVAIHGAEEKPASDDEERSSSSGIGEEGASNDDSGFCKKR